MALVTDAYVAYTQARPSTNGHAPTKPARRPTLVVLAAMLVTVARFAGAHLPRWTQVRTVVLSLAGFGCITAAAWTVAVPLGLLALGASFLVFELLTSDGR